MLKKPTLVASHLCAQQAQSLQCCRINPVPEGHRFPMPKDALLFEKLQSLGLAANTFTPTHPDTDTLCLVRERQQSFVRQIGTKADRPKALYSWLSTLRLWSAGSQSANSLSVPCNLQVHDRQYVESFLDGSISPQFMKRVGLTWSAPLVQRTLIGVGSAILAARLALQYGIGCMTNGGTHHAHRDYGSGEVRWIGRGLGKGPGSGCASCGEEKAAGGTVVGWRLLQRQLSTYPQLGGVLRVGGFVGFLWISQDCPSRPPPLRLQAGASSTTRQWLPGRRRGTRAWGRYCL